MNWMQLDTISLPGESKLLRCKPFSEIGNPRVFH